MVLLIINQNVAQTALNSASFTLNIDEIIRKEVKINENVLVKRK